MKVTNFGPDGIPIALGGWSSGVTSINSNAIVGNGGPNATNFVQLITSNSSNALLDPIVNFAAGSGIALSAASNTITITGTGGGSGSISAGSNSTRVSEDPSAGASSTLWSPFDHRHDGIGTITASSSNTMQRGAWNVRAGVGIALSLTDSDGDGEFDTATIVNTGVPGPAGTGGGGGSYSVPTFVQAKTSGTGNTALSLVMDATPANGNVLVLGSFSNGGAGLTTVVQTNVTWTKMVTGAAITATKMEIWIGKVGASASATITTTRAGGNAIWGVVEVSGVTVTPTLGVNGGSTDVRLPTALAATTSGHFVVMAAGGVSQTVVTVLGANVPVTGMPITLLAIVCAYSVGGIIMGNAYSNDGAGAAILMAEIT